MLNVLEAIQFTKVFTKGGRTEPWLIQVQVDGERTPYVVKLFTTDEIDHESTVAREVFGSVLAQQFDLSVPKPALIHFSKSFINTLPNDVRDILYFRDDRLKFGSAFCDNTSLLLPDLPATHLKIILPDADTIFAFDTLINNKDRGIYKPNILISNETDEYYLIDHERAFKYIEELIKEITSNQFSEILKQHVLYPYLVRKRNKQELFFTFEESIRTLNVNILDAYNQKLKEFNLQYNNISQLKNYLSALKQKSGWFVSIIRNSIFQ